MARALPPLTWFRSFEAAARHLNFTAAAQEIGLTQSAVSQQVKLLEQRLGAALFQRKARGLALTDAGRTLLPKVGASLEQLVEATAVFDHSPQAGVVTVAASVSVVRWIIAPHLDTFLTAHPGVKVRLIGTIWPDDFRNPLADVEIRFGSQAQVGAGADRLMPDGLIAVARDKVGLSDTRLIETVGTSEGWRDWAQTTGQAPIPEPSVFVDSYGAALDLAVQGVGAALVSRLLAVEALRSGRVKQLHPSAMKGTEGYFLACPSQDAPHPKAFAEWVRGLLLAES